MADFQGLLEETVDLLNDAPLSAGDVLRLTLERSPAAALACSFSVEDIVLIDLLQQVQPKPSVFAIDTGRLPEETYRLADRTEDHFGVKIEWFFPQGASVERLLHEQGTYGFRHSLEARHECCEIRKVEPLSRALSGRDAWLTGQRRGQSVTRRELPVAEIDHTHGGLLKVNVLAHWSSEQVWEHIRERNLPFNELYRTGYRSIGCAPCTRPVGENEDERAGRWWWESPEHRECGLHVRGLGTVQIEGRAGQVQ